MEIKGNCFLEITEHIFKCLMSKVHNVLVK